MKKTFQLTHPKIKYARLIETAKADIRKYLKRNRKKTLPEGAHFWDFKCKFGATEETAEVIHLAEVDKFIDQAEAENRQSFYIEVIPVAGFRTKKPESEKVESEKAESEKDDLGDESGE